MGEQPEKVPSKDLLFSDDAAIRKLPPICPQCGTWNPPEAKFCKKDGVKLPERRKYTGAPLSPRPDVQSEKGAESEGKPETANTGAATAGMDEPAKSAGSRAWQAKAVYLQTLKKHSLLLTICVLLVGLAGAGSCWYFFGSHRAAMQQNVDRKATVENEMNSPASPPGEPQPAAQSAPQPAAQSAPEPDVASTPPSVPEKRDRVRTEKVADKKQAQKRVHTASVKPKKDVKVAAAPDPKDIKPKEQADPAKVEGRLNRMLRSSEVGGVTAEVSENMTATLKGTVHSNKDRIKALSLARGFKEVKKVKDIIFVIEPQSQDKGG